MLALPARLLFVVFRCSSLLFLLLGTWLSYVVRYRGKTRNQEFRGALIRRLCERFGGAFIKVGQTMSLRYDYFSEEVCHQLSRLQDDVQTFSTARAMKMLDESLGRDHREVFSTIDPDSVAAASLSQVYRGVLQESGVEVAIKIKRPNIEYVIASDIFLFRILKVLAWVFGIGIRININAIIDEAIEILRAELDYQQEITSMEIAYADALRLPGLVVPRVYGQYCSRQVIVMDFLHGQSLRAVMAALDEGKPVFWGDGPLDLNVFTYKLFDITLRSIFITGFFHADPHPGNILLLENEEIGFIDFGATSFLTQDDRYQHLMYLRQLAADAPEKAAEIFAQMLQGTSRSDYPGVIRAMTMELKRYLAVVSDTGRPIRERSTATLYRACFQLAARYHFRLPKHVMMYCKAMFTMDNILLKFNPEYDSRIEAQRFLAVYFSEGLIERMSPEALFAQWEYLGIADGQLSGTLFTLANWMKRLQRGPSERGMLFSQIGRLFSRLTGFAFLGGAALLLASPWIWEPGIAPGWRIGLSVLCLFLGYRVMKTA